MRDRSKLDTVVDAMYDASLDPARWPEALAGVTQAAGGVGAYLYMVAPDRSVPFSLRYNLPESMEREYAEHYIQICPRVGYIQRHPGLSIIYDSMIMSEQEMDRHEFFEWIASYGFRYMIGSRLYQGPGEELYLGIQRTRKAGHVDQETIKHYEILTGHLSRAIKIARELGHLRSRVSALEELTDSSLFGVLFVDTDCRILYRNRAAQIALDEADGLLESDGALTAATPSARQKLAQLVRNAAAETDAVGMPCDDTTVIERPSRKRSYLVRAVPLRGEQFEQIRGKARVAVFITDPEASLEDAAAVIGRAFGLTPTEARVAAGLAEGHPLARIADHIGITERTARLHLEHVFFKTGTHKQHELVRLILLTTLGVRAI